MQILHKKYVKCYHVRYIMMMLLHEQDEHLNNLMRNNFHATGEYTNAFEFNACVFLHKIML